MAFDAQALLRARPDLGINWDHASSAEFRAANPDDPNVDGISAYGSLENYLRANWDAMGQPEFSSVSNESPVVDESPTSTGQFGGAADLGSVVAGGAVTAPISSGEGSTAVETGAGGNVIGRDAGSVISGPVGGNVASVGGDVSGPLVTAPLTDSPIIGRDAGIVITGPITGNGLTVGGDVSAPVVTAPIGGTATFGDDSPVAGPGGVASGRDSSIGGSVISGNTGPVNVTTSDPQVVTAAIDSAGSAINAVSSYADKALKAVTESQKPADERVTNSALTAVVVLVLGLGALALYRGKRAA